MKHSVDEGSLLATRRLGMALGYIRWSIVRCYRRSAKLSLSRSLLVS